MVGSHLESGLSVQSTLQVSGLHDSTCLHTGECGFTAYSSDRGLFQLGKCPAQALLAAGCESPDMPQPPVKVYASGKIGFSCWALRVVGRRDSGCRVLPIQY